MHAVDAEIDRASLAEKVVNASAALRRKVEYRSATRLSVRDQQIGRKLVGGVDKPTRRLEPWLNAPPMAEKIPAQNDGRDAGAHEGAAAFGSRETGAVGIEKVCIRVLRRSKSKPERHNVGAVFKLAGKDSMADHRGKDLARLKTGREETVVVAVAESIAAVEEWAVFPALVESDLFHRVDQDGGAVRPNPIRCLGPPNHCSCRQDKQKKSYDSRQRASLPSVKIL